MADRGHYRESGTTRQGIYVCSPSGKLLASINSLDPGEVAQTLDSGLAAWSELPDSERHLPANFAAQREARWEQRLPRDGLILESVNRELADATLPDERQRSDRWNRDHVWFSA